ncbi:MAG: malate synthase A [Candidatus Obscuribacter sp.]|nr:malate synthase A [Candidatus Obscuribacter sp.]
MIGTSTTLNKTESKVESKAIEQILTADAKKFLFALHRKFNPTRQDLLAARSMRQVEIDNGAMPDFLASTKGVRESQWQVAKAPADLDDRRVEITGPVERKMMINALNSGAKVFMADLEDSLSPTWANVIDGQVNLYDAVRGTLAFTSPEGKVYALKERSELATLVVRPRGWHLTEQNFEVDGEPISASLFDFGLYFLHNAEALIARQSGPYFYLPKMESHLEARLWQDVFCFAQDWLKIPRGTIRATVLIETILAAFEMDEILFELKEHAAGLNAGRWDYIFSLIKKCRKHNRFTLPDRAQVTMAVPFMSTYARLLVETCHKRGAHAIGGMAAFIPSRKDEQVNQNAFAKVKEDKQREVGLGFDGTWVAHPDLVPVAREIFDSVLKDKPNQKDVSGKDESGKSDAAKLSEALLDTRIDGGKVTTSGVAANVDVALQYIESWLRGVGAAAIHNLMEDAATAEIARAQIWQWIKSETKTAEGDVVTSALYEKLRDEALAKLSAQPGNRYSEAAKILDQIILSDQFVEFLTIPAYKQLLRG